MVDLDTFLTTLDVMIDDFGTTAWPLERHPGPQAILSRSEVMTLAMFGPWQGLGRERGLYRSAQRHLRAAFPSWPTREPCTRQMRQPHEALGALFLHRVQLRAAQHCPDAALDSAGLSSREAKRRGAGWWPAVADRGWSTRLGWDEGFPRLRAVHPVGVMTGFGVGAARTKDQPLAAPVFARRRWPQPGRPRVGAPALGPSVVDQGVAGQVKHGGVAADLWGPGPWSAQAASQDPVAADPAALAGGHSAARRNGRRHALSSLTSGAGAAP
jgi:hypothetical protein